MRMGGVFFQTLENPPCTFKGCAGSRQKGQIVVGLGRNQPGDPGMKVLVPAGLNAAFRRDHRVLRGLRPETGPTPHPHRLRGAPAAVAGRQAIRNGDFSHGEPEAQAEFCSLVDRLCNIQAAGTWDGAAAERAWRSGAGQNCPELAHTATIHASCIHICLDPFGRCRAFGTRFWCRKSHERNERNMDEESGGSNTCDRIR